MERAQKAEVVGQALVWLVITETDPDLSSHSGSKANKKNVQ